MSDTIQLNSEIKRQLLQLARSSIAYSFETKRALLVPKNLFDSNPELNDNGACFVTLMKNGKLRGCTGSLEAYRPLTEDIVEHAHNAAFRDPRFPALTQEELADLVIEISILSTAKEFSVDSEQDLINKLKPGEDGLVIQSGQRRATFLPSVWEQLPNPADFVQELKLKGGFSEDEWPEDMVVERYHTTSFSEQH